MIDFFKLLGEVGLAIFGLVMLLVAVVVFFAWVRIPRAKCEVCSKIAYARNIVPYPPSARLCLSCALAIDAELEKKGVPSQLPMRCEACNQYIEGPALPLLGGPRVCPDCFKRLGPASFRRRLG